MLNVNDDLIAAVLHTARRWYGQSGQALLIDQWFQYSDGLINIKRQCLKRPTRRAQPGRKQRDLRYAQAHCIDVFNVFKHLAHGSSMQDLPLIYHHHLINEMDKLLKLMLYQQSCAALHTRHQGKHFLAPQRIDVRRWFVENKCCGIKGQNRRQCASLLLTSREIVRVLATMSAHARQCQQMPFALTNRIHGQPVIAGAKDDLIFDGRIEQLRLRVLLEHPHNLRERTYAELPRIILPGNRDLSAHLPLKLVRDQAVSSAADCGLSGATGTCDEQDATFWQINSYIVNDVLTLFSICKGEIVVLERIHLFLVRHEITFLLSTGAQEYD